MPKVQLVWRFTHFALAIGILTMLMGFSAPQAWAGECDCESFKCSPCEDQTNVEFYTEKCGTSGKMKSCSKPICAPKDPAPAECLGRDLASVKEPPKVELAAAPKKELKPVGTVMISVGEVTVMRDKIRNPLKVNQKIFNNDEIETGENAKAKIVFVNDDNLVISPKTKALITVSDLETGKDSTLLDLMYGTLRSVVKKRGQQGAVRFRIKTPSAVAGVKGTEFLTTYYESARVTKVQTLEGSVELAALKGNQRVTVPAGNFASYVLDSGNAVDSARSIKYVEGGFITPLERISEKEMADIEHKTGFSETRVVASSPKRPAIICHSPGASLNQCFWKCVGNPPGAKVCRTDLPKVKCVRSRCNANGEWADEQRLPASEHEKCSVKEILVDDCDY